MAIETERKFLVTGEFKHLATGLKRITQRYLSADNEKTIRLRITDDEAFLTIKYRISKQSFARFEWELPVPYSDAIEMMSVCIPGKIVKTRYLIPAGKHTIEVDVFHDKNEGLVIAEIELASEDEYYEKPAWLGEEVTGRLEYYNVNLLK